MHCKKGISDHKKIAVKFAIFCAENPIKGFSCILKSQESLILDDSQKPPVSEVPKN